MKKLSVIMLLALLVSLFTTIAVSAEEMNVFINPGSVTVQPFNTAELECYYTDTTKSVSFIWYETTTGELKDIIALDGGTKTNKTLLVDTSKEGVRYYACAVILDGNYTQPYYSDIAKVTVTSASPFTPVIKDQPKTTAVYEGQYATFKVNATNVFRYEWVCSDGGSPLILKNGNGISGCDTATLSVLAKNPNDLQIYYCRLYGTDGTMVHTEGAELKILKKVTETLPPVVTTVTESESAKPTETEPVITTESETAIESESEKTVVTETETKAPDNNSGTESSFFTSPTFLIIVIAAAVVIIAILVVVLIVLNKKK